VRRRAAAAEVAGWPTNRVRTRDFQARSIADEPMIAWVKKAAVLLAVVAGVLFLWRGLLLLAAGVGLCVVAAIGIDRWRKWRAVRRFRAKWSGQGRDVLLVYSNSPNWQAYIEEAWLQRWGHRAVVLNWSERRTWRRRGSPEVQLFRAFGGEREFNPLGIVVPPAGREVHVVRFWRAFRDRKHGKRDTLSQAEAELDHYLSAASATSTPLPPTSGAAHGGGDSTAADAGRD
jgi:hypothetical protein